MHVSASELASTITKAAQGVGVPIGLGVEVGRATCIGLMHDTRALVCVLRALERLDNDSVGRTAPLRYVPDQSIIAPSSELLSAILAGPPACDLLSARTARLTLHAVDEPALVTFQALARADHQLPQVVARWTAVEGVDVEAFCQRGALRLDAGDGGSFWLEGPCHVELSAARTDLDGPPATDRLSASLVGYEVEKDIWRRLEKLADRCLVPASENSRLSGAGAGLVETD